jgi:hypothetical protein
MARFSQQAEEYLCGLTFVRGKGMQSHQMTIRGSIEIVGDSGVVLYVHITVPESGGIRDRTPLRRTRPFFTFGS